MIKEKLINIGFSETEARIVLFILNNHRVKITDVARHLDVTHPSAREQLEKLVAKQILLKKKFEKSQYYFINGSKAISQMIQREIKEFENKQQDHLKIAQEIDSLIGSKLTLDKEAKTNVYYLKGIEGINRLVDTVINSGAKTVYEFVDMDLVFYKDKAKTNNLANKYEKAGIRFEAIYTSEQEELDIGVSNSDAVHLKKKYVTSPTAQILAFADKVALSFVTDDRTIILIENKWVANTFKTLVKRLKELEKQVKK